MDSTNGRGPPPPPPPPPHHHRPGQPPPSPPPPPPFARPVHGLGFSMSGPPNKPQCFIGPDQWDAHTLFKINGKPDGLNSMLAAENSASNQLVFNVPTIIIGMDVSRHDTPSIAAVVHSREWPQIFEYRAYMQTLPPEVEMIDSLYKPVTEGDGKMRDSGIMSELLQDFYASSGNRKPEQIIIFRYGVSESQLTQVWKAEVDQIMEIEYFPRHARSVTKCSPDLLVIMFFEHRYPKYVPSGTIKNDKVCDGFNFYLRLRCGMIDTTMPRHYRVVLDQIGLSDDGLQELVDSLSYVHQLRTVGISLVAPAWYGIKTPKLEEPETKRMKAKIELEEVNLRRDREFIEGGAELALYALGHLNDGKARKYKFERYLYDRYGCFGYNASELKLWQHVSMFARKDNESQMIIFAELSYSNGEYETITHSVLDPNEPAGIIIGCGMCFPSIGGDHPSPHPADASKYVVGHWPYLHSFPKLFGLLPGPPKSDHSSTLLKHKLKDKKNSIQKICSKEN